MKCENVLALVTEDNVVELPKSTLVEKPTQVTNPTKVAYRTTEQDSSVAFEARASEGLERGYTRVPNSILMKLIEGTFTKNEIKIALLIARFTISFRKDAAPLSKKVLERRSGLRGPAVLEAVSGLVAKGIVTKQQGDQCRPNMLGLVLPPNWQELDRPAKKEQEVVTRQPSVGMVGSTTYPEVGNPTGGQVTNPTPIKDTKTIINLSSLPDSLQTYFQELKPAKKRESEWRAFEMLSSDYSAQDIADGLELLITRGIRFTKRSDFQPCHSPMAYLAKAMKDVLREVSRSRKTQPSRNENTTSRDLELAQQAQAKSQSESERVAMEEAFESAFPSSEDQQALIEQVCQTLPFQPSEAVRRIYAVSKWWSELENKPLESAKP